jgi:hypothetical protein
MLQKWSAPVPEKDVWEWLSIVETDGPFLSKAALKSIYPSGLPQPDASVDDVNATFSHEFKVWEAAWRSNGPESYTGARDRWVTAVLRDLLLWNGDLNINPDASLVVHSPDGRVSVQPWATLDRGDGPVTLVTVVDRTENLRALPNDGWAADSIDRMAALLRETGVPVGLVTDGQWWAIVSARTDVTTASGVFDASLWTQERPSRNAFFALVGFASLASGEVEKRLPALFELSIASAEQITEALGDQVRRAVELILQSLSDVHLRAILNDDVSPLPTDAKLVYEAAVTVMMRVVFLLFAEERGLLPTHDLYRAGYAIAGVRRELEKEATDNSPEALDHTWETWHRLLAVSSAVYNGASFEDLRMPAYGGSLFDPERFPWLTAVDTHGRLAVRVSDRAMLEVLNAVQVAHVGGEARHLSFRDLDVEQIGYVYEGLLGYSAAYVDELVVGLEGSKAGFEPEIALSELESIAGTASTSSDFAKGLIAHLKKTQENSRPRTANQLTKAYSLTDAEKKADAKTALGHVLLGDQDAVERLLPFHALVRRDLRGFPYVVPAGGLVMTESPQRANTGTHYTPRSLAEEVVLHALQPLVYSPGPLDIEDEKSWVLKSSAEILDLKVADIAVGSGAFLVAAARFLADRLLEARARAGLDVEGEPDLKRWAIREVVARCLYGADINAMAVEMCKLSLWLISMDPGKPFSFVDDRVFHGNSLLGVTTEAQLKAQHIFPKQSVKRQLAAFDVDKDLEDAARLRRELASGQVDDADLMRSTRAKRALLDQSKDVTAKLRDVADGIIAAGLLEGGKPGRKLEERYDVLAEARREAYPADGSEGDRRRLDTIIDAGVTPTVDTGEARWKPLHWILEAPDVIHDHGGFDAIIGNPPFLGGQKLTSSMGTSFRDWIVHVLAEGERGSADLVAYFFLRTGQLLSSDGVFGLIGTNSLAQGDSRQVGLDRLVFKGFTLTRAIQSRAWPAAGANLEYAAVWGTRRPVPNSVPRYSEGRPVRSISTLLEPGTRLNGEPIRLAQNASRAFQGCIVLGMGFVVDDETRTALIVDDPRNSNVVRAYLSGEDLNQRPDSSPSRFVIDFSDLPEHAASTYEGPFERVRQLVRPERESNKMKERREKWWQFGSRAPALRRAVNDFEDVIAIARVSKTVMPVRVPNGSVFHEKLVVFGERSYAFQAIVSSSVHQLWTIKYGTTMRVDATYTPERCFETLPQPDATPGLTAIGERLDRDRREIMLRRQLGLTALYNLVNSPEVQGDADVHLIRSIHVQIDEAVMEAYGWTDIPLEHGFHTYRQMERWTVSPAARVEILDRLLEENHRRAAIEAQQNPKKSTRGKSFEESEKPEGALI